MKETNGKGPYEEETDEGEDGKHYQLRYHTASKSVCDAGKHGSDREADDEEIACRELQNQADYSQYGPYLP
jgi:hypothetical protein